MIRRGIMSVVLATSLAACVSGSVTTERLPAVERASAALDRLRPSALVLIERLPPSQAIVARLVLRGVEEALRAARSASSAKLQAAELSKAAEAMTMLVDGVR